jgi:hypothetical protein
MNEEQVAPRAAKGPVIQELGLDRIRESTSNPRRAFDEVQLREFADFVPDHKIRVMWPSPLCGVRT